MILNEIEKKEIAFYSKKFNFIKNIKDKTFLITGSKGITGQAIIKWLLFENMYNNANVKIFASTRNPSQIPNYVESSDDIKFLLYGHEDEVNSVHFDYIFQNAAPTSNKIFKEKPADSLNVILDGTKRALDISRRDNANMIYLSSEEAYGLLNSDDEITEDNPGSSMDSLNYRSCYPLGKKVSELLCKTYCIQYGINVKMARPSVIQGLTQSYDIERVDNEILRCILENKNLIMKSKGLTKKCIVYTLDVVSALFYILFNGVSGEAYNITNAETFMSIKDRASLLFNRFNKNVTIQYEENDVSVAQGYLPYRSVLLSVEKIKSLGWEPLADLYHIYEVDIERFKINVR